MDNSDDSDESQGDSDDEEKQFREDLKQIQKLKKRQKGKKDTAAVDMDLEEESDDAGDAEEGDSDYEYMAGDLAIYDSTLDDVDEILYVKDTLERINQAD